MSAAGMTRPAFVKHPFRMSWNIPLTVCQNRFVGRDALPKSCANVVPQPGRRFGLASISERRLASERAVACSKNTKPFAAKPAYCCNHVSDGLVVIPRGVV